MRTAADFHELCIGGAAACFQLVLLEQLCEAKCPSAAVYSIGFFGSISLGVVAPLPSLPFEGLSASMLRCWLVPWVSQMPRMLIAIQGGDYRFFFRTFQIEALVYYRPTQQPRLHVTFVRETSGHIQPRGLPREAAWRIRPPQGAPQPNVNGARL